MDVDKRGMVRVGQAKISFELLSDPGVSAEMLARLAGCTVDQLQAWGRGPAAPYGFPWVVWP